jgi:hypothetical protein
MKPKHLSSDERLSGIIKSYKTLRLKKPDTWSKLSAEQATLQGAIVVSAMSINRENKRCPHQYRIRKVVLEQVKDELLVNIRKIRKAKHFDELYTIVRSLQISGIGPLTSYDIALRIGAFLKLYPDRVYLHAGTKVGTRKLLGEVPGEYLLKSDLPRIFRGRKLTYSEIEDILCIYKDRFTKQAGSALKKASVC